MDRRCITLARGSSSNMDDLSFERWSEDLAQLRRARQSAIEQELQEKAESFLPSIFFDLVKKSLDQLMEKWFEYEQQSWNTQIPSDPAQALETIRAEMESIVDFENESVSRDMASIQSRITWPPDALPQAEPPYRAFLDELRKKYQIKIKGLAGSSKRKNVEPVLQVVRSSGHSRSSSGSGVGFFLMFLVGLLLGGGPSIYFMDVSKKIDRKYQEERSKLLSDQRALADSMTLLKDSFDRLAQGKMKNMPDLERETLKLKNSYSQKIQEVEKNHLNEREKTLKKIPAGNRLDTALEQLEKGKEDQLEELKAEQAAVLEPLQKQQDKLKDLMVH